MQSAQLANFDRSWNLQEPSALPTAPPCPLSPEVGGGGVPQMSTESGVSQNPGHPALHLPQPRGQPGGAGPPHCPWAPRAEPEACALFPARPRSGCWAPVMRVAQEPGPGTFHHHRGKDSRDLAAAAPGARPWRCLFPPCTVLCPPDGGTGGPPGKGTLAEDAVEGRGWLPHQDACRVCGPPGPLQPPPVSQRDGLEV